MVVRELPMLKSTKGYLKGFGTGPPLADIPIEETEGEVLVLIGHYVPEAHWILE